MIKSRCIQSALLIFLITFSSLIIFGCRTDERSVNYDEKFIVPTVKYSQVRNEPYGNYTMLRKNLRINRDEDFDFLNAIVIWKTDKTLKLQTLDQTLDVEVKPDTVYRMFIGDETTAMVQRLEGDHFDDIQQYDYITLSLNTDSDGSLFTEAILIYQERAG